MKYLIDSDIFTQMVKGLRPEINTRLKTLKSGEGALSVITHAEHLYGVAHASITSERFERAQRLIHFFGVLPITQDVSHHYGTLRAYLRAKGLPIGPNDMWIAAHALSLNCTLVTNNTREFSRVPKLKLENWLIA